MANNYTSPLTTVFSMGGKTYIGTIGGTVDTTAMATITRGLSPAAVPPVADEEYIYIQKPALVEFKLEQKADSAGTYELKWTVTPLVFSALLQGQALAHNVFLFKKADIAFSGIDAETDLKAELVSAYKELV